MSIFKVLEGNIRESKDSYSSFIDGFKGDLLKGVEFMFYGLTNTFSDKDIDALEKGIVDSSYRKETYDFGIDAVFITASDDFLEEPEEIDNYTEDTKFKIHLFQFKSGNGISQADLLKFNNGIKKAIIDQNITEEDNLYFFNRMNVLNQIIDKLYNTFPVGNIAVYTHIVFGGLKATITNEKILSDEVKKITQLLESNGFSKTKPVITDTQDLIAANNKFSQISDIIEYQKTFKYITDTDNNKKLNGYISIIKGSDVAELVRKYGTSIFEANIRDYHKNVELNSRIIETSTSEREAKFFWSYNNGLTMTCSKVEDMPNNRYKLHNLQIVNGCQTSNAIYIALKNKERVEELNNKINRGDSLTKKELDELTIKMPLQFRDETNILVKIIETNDEDLIYRITETTNSQTPIKAFSLRANDDIQKLIEKYLDQHNINYERRINYLRNQGKKNIYSIQKLFQLYTSQILFKPSQVLTNTKLMFSTNYDTVFPELNVKQLNFVTYLIPIKVDIALKKAKNDYLKSNPTLDSYTKTMLTYGRLHLGCFLLSSILKSDYSEKGIVNNEAKIIDELENNLEHHFIDSIENLKRILFIFGRRNEAIPAIMKKIDLESRTVRFIKNRK